MSDETIQNENPDIMTDETSVLDKLENIERQLIALTEQIPTLIDDAIEKKDLVSRGYMDKRFQDYSPTLDINTLLNVGFSALKEAVVDSSEAFNAAWMAQQIVLDEHSRDLLRKSETDKEQQQILSDLVASQKILLEEMPKVTENNIRYGVLIDGQTKNIDKLLALAGKNAEERRDQNEQIDKLIANDKKRQQNTDLMWVNIRKWGFRIASVLGTLATGGGGLAAIDAISRGM